MLSSNQYQKVLKAGSADNDEHLQRHPGSRKEGGPIRHFLSGFNRFPTALGVRVFFELVPGHSERGALSSVDPVIELSGLLFRKDRASEGGGVKRCLRFFYLFPLVSFEFLV